MEQHGIRAACATYESSISLESRVIAWRGVESGKYLSFLLKLGILTNALSAHGEGRGPNLKVT